jgi:hypothetical protein
MYEPKIVSLDDLNKSVIIPIGDREFKISRLTLQISKLYGEYLIACGEYAKKVSDTKLLADESNDLPGLEKLSEEMQSLVESFARDKAERITKMLSLILEKNGYEYDQDWWEENARYQDMEQFIFYALKKDEDEKAPKKKLAES